MNNSRIFLVYDRKDWRSLRENASLSLTEKNLNNLRAVNDVISMEDVQEVYVPIIQLLDVYVKSYYRHQASLINYLNLDQPKKYQPYVIGIAGSVAVGKSTVARLLKSLLSDYYPEKKVDLLTTDGFLYPNKILKERDIMDRKGFPESYDMKRLINFMTDVKNNVPNIQVPKYSHQVYDIVEGERLTINQPDILIVEGINVLQLPSNEKIFVSDFFDFSFYVDASENLIEKWYMQRFGTFMDTAFKDPNNYYYKFNDWDREEAFAYANQVWETVNLENLREYILPTRLRANLILHKTHNHYIDKILLKKH